MTKHDDFLARTAREDDVDADTGGDRDLADRAALRRVGSLSTQLTDITEVEYRDLQLEQVVLVGVWSTGTAQDAEASMTELARLAETAGSVVLEALSQRRRNPDASTYIGSGKVQELLEVVQLTGADTVICDGELSPGQLRNLEERLKVKVVDRTALILDIFAQHAKSKEGKAQVELAQLNYFLPRLRGWGIALSRQRGGRVAAGAGIGSRGPGETKLEIDRRRIHRRIAQLKSELAGMRQVRDTKRSQRRANASRSRICRRRRTPRAAFSRRPTAASPLTITPTLWRSTGSTRTVRSAFTSCSKRATGSLRTICSRSRMTFTRSSISLWHTVSRTRWIMRPTQRSAATRRAFTRQPICCGDGRARSVPVKPRRRSFRPYART